MGAKAIRMALPKGRLMDNVLQLLSESGVTFTFKNERDYTPKASDRNISAKVVKVRAIPQLLALGQFTVGFAGLDLLKEARYGEVVPILDLGLNPVKLVVAVNRKHKDILSNPPKRPILIATEYENIAHEWAMQKGLAHIIIQTWGSTEAYAPDDADIVFDNVDTGVTMASNNLVVIDEIMRSSTHMVVNANAYRDKDAKKFVDDLAKRMRDRRRLQ